MGYEYASNAKANGALATGIVGATLSGLLTLGAGGRLMNGGMMDGTCNQPITKFEMEQQSMIAAKDAEIALLKSEQNTEVKIADVYERIITRINQDQREQQAWNANQAVANAQMSSAIAVNNNSIAAIQNILNNLTKVVIPATSVCPEPMSRYNSWTAPTSSTTTG